MAMLAQAAGVASMPFFASLWAKERRFEFATQVADSVSRVACMGLLVASAMVALGKPTIDLRLYWAAVFPQPKRASVSATLPFSRSRCFCGRHRPSIHERFLPRATRLRRWSRDRSLPCYRCPYILRSFTGYGAMGLAFASDIGIAMQTLTIAGLLHQRRMVSMASLDYREMGRCLVAAVASGAAVWAAFSLFGGDAPARAASGRAQPLAGAAELVAGPAVLGHGCSLDSAQRPGRRFPES